MKKIANGIWKITLGSPERNTPVNLLKMDIQYDALNKLICSEEFPVSEEKIYFKQTQRGCVVEISMQTSEDIYGFGLQLYSINQVGRKKHIRVNSDPVADTGDSHAPVPFYVSTAGYGVYVDTARYVSFYCGTNAKKGTSRDKVKKRKEHTEFSENALYAVKKVNEERAVMIDIPSVHGVDIYIFAGPDIKSVVQRYNLFSGGGCIPPAWGLGVWYRAYGGSKEDDVYRLAQEFRNSNMPVDVFGIEPGWHSHSYSCSYKWDEVLFPNFDKMLVDLNEMNYKVNLWEHLFVHPTADIYKDLMEYSGDYEVWEGLVPDFSLEEAKKIFADHHGKELIDKGVAGFKLDECDNSDYNPSSWSFPNCAQFPSGMDGELMHNMIGSLYQKTLLSAFEERNKRTLSQVRSSGALAASLPFVLYSDLYKHREFIRGVATVGFSGLLWSPEVRDCSSAEDLIRRVQCVMLSPHALLNCWRIPNPPWKQVNLDKNLAGEFMEGWEETEALCRKFFEIRMSLIPYLYSSFARYQQEGLPPFRAMVMDYPEDANTHQLDSQYMMGESMIVAPMILEDGECREVYLPEGNWYDFWTNEIYHGGQTYDVKAGIDRIPVFVKEGTLLPYSKPIQSIKEDTCFDITVRCYGENCKDFVLFEDDGFTFDYKNGVFNRVHLKWSKDGNHKVVRSGKYEGVKYNIIQWIEIKD